MAWYDKYVDGTASMGGGGGMSPGQALNIRQMEFKQQMKERKELDKYMRKQARKERLLSRPGGSFKSKKKKAHWAWLAELEQKSPQAAAYYRYTQERKGAKKRWKSEQKRRRKAGAIQRSADESDGNRNRLYTHDGKPIRHTKVGMSGAPQFMSLASMGYKSPGQLGFKTYTGQPNYRYTPPGASGRGRQRRREKTKEGRQAPRAWAERQESLGRPSDYATYLADRRLQMSTGLQDPMGSAISAGQQAAGMVGQGIDRINPNKPGNIFHSAGQWLGGMAPSGPTRPSFPGAQVPDGAPPADLTDQSPAIIGGPLDPEGTEIYDWRTKEQIPMVYDWRTGKPMTSQPQGGQGGGYPSPGQPNFYGNLFRSLMQGMWGGVLDELD